MKAERLAAWMMLLNSGVSNAAIRRLLAALGEPERVVRAPDKQLAAAGELRGNQMERLREAIGNGAFVERQLRSYERHAMRAIECGDTLYPPRLERTADPPPVLFVKGDYTPSDRVAVAIVGSRVATPYGLEAARRIAVALAPVATVSSGLAVGIDSMAHETALRAGGRTIGVAACGLDRDYPRPNRKLRERIPGQGALLSAHPPLATPSRGAFPRRNYILAGLSLAVVVVEASEQSGALLTARAAAEEGREVYAVPGDITKRSSKGSNRLIADGATIVTEPGDILAGLEDLIRRELRAVGALEPAGPASTPAVPAGLSEDEKRILGALGDGPVQYDALIAGLVPEVFELGALTQRLLEMELKGLVRQLPGQLYQAC